MANMKFICTNGCMIETRSCEEIYERAKKINKKIHFGASTKSSGVNKTGTFNFILIVKAIG